MHIIYTTNSLKFIDTSRIKLYKWNNKIIFIEILKNSNLNSKKSKETVKKLIARHLQKNYLYLPFNFKNDNSEFKKEIIEIELYLERKIKEFSFDYLLIGSLFQKKVWNSLRKIHYGTTKSYSDIAHQIKTPKSSRAVGNACGQNHLPILIPCHRVIKANNTPGGFSLGGKIKNALLALENIVL